MADQNLTIGIRADSSQLRADLALVQAQMSQLSQQMRAAAKESLLTGDTSGLRAIAGQFQAAVVHAKTLKTELAASSGEALNFSQRLKEAGQGLEQVAGQFRGGLGGLLGAGGLSGTALGIAAATAAVGEVVHLATSAAEHAHEIMAFASAIGVSTGQVREWTHAAAEAGVNEELLTKTIERQTIAAEKAAEALHKNTVEAAKLIDATGGLLRGGLNIPPPPPTSKLIDVGASVVKDTPKLREFAQSIYDADKAVEEMKVKAGQIPDTLQSFSSFLNKLRQDMVGTTPEAAKLREEFAKMGGDAPIKSMAEGIARLEPGFKDAFTKIGVDVLDANGNLRKMAGILDDIHEKLKSLPDPEALKFMRDTGGRGAIDPTMVSFFKTTDAFRTAAGQDADIKAGDEAWKAEIKTLAQLKEAAFQTGLGIDSAAMAMAANIGDVTKNAIDLATDLGKVDEERFDNVSAGLKGLADLAGSVAAKIADVISSAKSMPAGLAAGVDAAGNVVGSQTGFAMGGMVRGPGTGTSDSMWARVSNGEFWVNAAATARNLPLLHAINNGFSAPRFALGGLVDALSSPAFTSGGLVTASASAGGGGAVHLHFPHETIAVQTDAQTLAQVGRAARQANLLSAGRKPSSIGGR